METLFPLGQILATPSALAEAGSNPVLWILRHAAGDCEQLHSDDMKANAEVLRYGSLILSTYVLPTGVKTWIITEAEDDEGHREATTILLPSEY